MKKASHSQSMQPQYCHQCATRVSSDDLYCPKCGASLFNSDTPSNRRTGERKSGFPRSVAAILIGVVACLVLVMLIVPRFTSGGKQRPASADALASSPQPTSDGRELEKTLSPTETKKENCLMEFHAASGVPMFNIPELMDTRISSYTFRSTLAGAPADAWDVSQEQDGSVLAWLEKDGQEKHMILAADGIIKAPQDCHSMFHNQSATLSIRFNGCLDTSEVTDMSDMFGLCRSLTELDLTGFDTSNVTDMSGMFMFCESIKTLDLSSFDTAMVSDMSEMFYGCYELTSVITDGINMSGVADRELMFFQCNQLNLSSIHLVENHLKDNDALGRPWLFDIVSSPDEIVSISFRSSLDGAPGDAVDVSHEKDRSVMAWAEPCGEGKEVIVAANGKIIAPSDCSYMFAYCSNLSSISFNDCLDTSQVTDMSQMFYFCESLTSLDVSSFDTGNVMNMGGMFGNCISLKQLDLSNFNTSKVTNMAGLLGASLELTDLDLSGFDTSHVTNFGCMFTCCENLTTLKIEVLDMTGWLFGDSVFSGCHSLDLESIPIIAPTGQETMNRLKHVEYAEILKEIEDKPGMITHIRFESSLDGAPAGAWDLSEYQDGSVLAWVEHTGDTWTLITAADGIIKAPEDCSHMFCYCFVTSIEFNDCLDTSETTDMSMMFAAMLNLTELDVSSLNTSNVRDMDGMFMLCPTTSLDLSNFDTRKVTTMTYMFQECKAESLDISNFDTSNVTNMEGMFWACIHLNDLKATVLNMVNVDQYRGMFYACDALDVSNISFNPATWTWVSNY